MLCTLIHAVGVTYVVKKETKSTSRGLLGFIDPLGVKMLVNLTLSCMLFSELKHCCFFLFLFFVEPSSSTCFVLLLLISIPCTSIISLVIIGN